MVNMVSILVTYFDIYNRMLSDILIAGPVAVACAVIVSCMFLLVQRIDEKPEIPE